jgi:uncharacterized protein YdhG (YjbR/CyaY superfamily)
MNPGVKTINEYIAGFPAEVQEILEHLRTTILAAAPGAEEDIRYQMPTFRLKNKNVVHFAAYKNHIGLYPAPSGIEAFQHELAPYKRSKGTIQFPINQPLPFELIDRIVRFRVTETLNSQ